MGRLKGIGLLLAVTCALAGVAASGAQAAIHWNVNGAPLGAGVSEAIAEKVELTKVESGESKPSLTVTVSGLLRINCTGLGYKGAKITGTNKGSASSLTFTGCVVQNTKGETQTKCTVKNEGGTVGTILTSAVQLELKEVSGSAYDIFTPTTGTFVAVVIGATEGGSCALSGTNKMTGSVGVKFPLGTNGKTLEKEASAATASAAGTALSYGARSAVLDGKGDLSLASGNTWGVGP